MDKKQEAFALKAQGMRSDAIGLKINVPGRTVRSWLSQPKQVEEHPVLQAVGTPIGNISLQNGTVIVFGDSHLVPGQESAAAKALKILTKEIKPNIEINIGDIYDFASISKHPQIGWNPQLTVKDELQAGYDFMNELINLSPQTRFFMLEGNHDTRFNKFLANHIPQFKGVPGFDLRDHLPKGWAYTMSIMINNNTVFLHAHHCGVHAAYNNTLKGGLSVVTGHTHILEAKPFVDFRGARYGVQTGTLATIQGNPLFAYTLGSPLNWMAGFVVLTYIDSVLQYPEICSINSAGQAIFRGKLL